MIDTENRIGSYNRSASWRITRTINQMSLEEKEHLLRELHVRKACNNLMGQPINERLLNTAMKALTGVSVDELTAEVQNARR